MKSKHIEKYISNLSWNKRRIVQQKAIDELIKMDGSQWFLVLPRRNYNKDLWENAAIVLSKKEFDQIEGILVDLFYWFQDLNWPGVDIILNLLKRIPKEAFEKALSKARIIAETLEDYEWLSNLDHIFQ
jgi:hypothetical protein